MEDNNNILDNHYNLIKDLGRGAYSNIYLVNNINDNNQYAARIRRNGHDNPYFQDEIEMTSRASGLNNPYIIHLNRFGEGTLNKSGIVTNNVNYMICRKAC